MAITAIQTDLTDVDGMRKGHRLRRLVAHPRKLWGQIISDTTHRRRTRQYYTGNDPHGQFIRPLWKYVRHVIWASALHQHRVTDFHFYPQNAFI